MEKMLKDDLSNSVHALKRLKALVKMQTSSNCKTRNMAMP
jgi:hypothetical protein